MNERTNMTDELDAAEGLIAGALLAVDSGDRPLEEADKKLLAAGALFLSKQMEL